jgi:FkbM family methyltransferase
MRKLNVFVYEASAAAGFPSPDLPVYLTEHYAQCAEDVIVAGLLHARALRLGLDLAQARYLEIGGNHPISSSATLLLQRKFGMRGVIVEANPRLLDDLRRGRPDDVIVHAAVQSEDVPTVRLSVANANELSSIDRSFVLEWDNGKIGEREYVEVPAMRVNQVVEQYLGGQSPIFMSVDIEGMDLDVLRDFDFVRYRPAVVQAEPSDYQRPNNTTHMIELLDLAGYDLIARTDVNLIFLDRQGRGPATATLGQLDDLQSRLVRIEQIVSEIRAVLERVLRPLRWVWRRALPLRVVVARLRGRIP